jgi:hypothetical protein
VRDARAVGPSLRSAFVSAAVHVPMALRVEGYGRSAVGGAQFGPVSVSARARYAASTGMRNDDVESPGIGERSEKSRAEPIFGADVAFHVWRGLVVRLDRDRARARTAVGEKFHADLYFAGVGWRF